MFKEIIKPSLILFLVCAIIAGALAYVNGVTQPIIAENDRVTEQESLAQVLPGSDSFKEPVEAETLKDKGLKVSDRIVQLYEAQKGGETSGYVVEVNSKGYGGDIKIFVGVDTQSNITGVTLVNHNETAGLGAKAADAAFTQQYLGKIPEKTFSVVKGVADDDNEIEAISGATISSKAVTQGVEDAVQLIRSLLGGA